jgi:hypothetical protein
VSLRLVLVSNSAFRHQPTGRGKKHYLLPRNCALLWTLLLASSGYLHSFITAHEALLGAVKVTPCMLFHRCNHHQGSSAHRAGFLGMHISPCGSSTA